jgi:hypothetical protein
MKEPFVLQGYGFVGPHPATIREDLAGYPKKGGRDDARLLA